MLFVLLQHAVALEAAAIAQVLHNLHQTDLAVEEAQGRRKNIKTHERVEVLHGS